MGGWVSRHGHLHGFVTAAREGRYSQSHACYSHCSKRSPAPGITSSSLLIGHVTSRGKVTRVSTPLQKTWFKLVPGCTLLLAAES